MGCISEAEGRLQKVLKEMEAMNNLDRSAFLAALLLRAFDEAIDADLTEAVSRRFGENGILGEDPSSRLRESPRRLQPARN